MISHLDIDSIQDYSKEECKLDLWESTVTKEKLDSLLIRISQMLWDYWMREIGYKRRIHELEMKIKGSK